MFAERGVSWTAYGEFSAFKLLAGYQGPWPANDDFVPYNGSPEQLLQPKNPRLIHAFRRGMLLHGVDLMGLSGMTTAAHTEDDVDKTVAAVAGTVELLREEGLA
jgi:glutamate-1-semialdehyde 2,1-aminomutase